MKKNNILVIIFILLCSMLVFPVNLIKVYALEKNNVVASSATTVKSGTICKYSGGKQGKNYELTILWGIARTKPKNIYGIIQKSLCIDDKTKGIFIGTNNEFGDDERTASCPEIIIYDSEYIYMGNTDDKIIKNKIESDIGVILNLKQNMPNSNNGSYFKCTGDNNNNNSGVYELDYSSNNPCSNNQVASAVKVVGKVISIIQIVVPIILIIIALVDLAKSIVSMDDAKSKKTVNLLVKRIISAIIVFFIIAIVKFICGIVGSDSISNGCLDLISNPWK